MLGRIDQPKALEEDPNCAWINDGIFRRSTVIASAQRQHVSECDKPKVKVVLPQAETL
jgi:hypothetical protein